MARTNRELIIQRLTQHAGELSWLLQGLTDEQLVERPSPHKWSLHELAMHIVETQDVFIERLAVMLTEPEARITPYKPDKAREDGLYLEWHLPFRLKTFKDQRSALTGLLGTLTEEQWRHEAFHPEVKHYTVEKAMESMMRHEEHHLYQMFNIFFGFKE